MTTHSKEHDAFKAGADMVITKGAAHDAVVAEAEAHMTPEIGAVHMAADKCKCKGAGKA